MKENNNLIPQTVEVVERNMLNNLDKYFIDNNGSFYFSNYKNNICLS